MVGDSESQSVEKTTTSHLSSADVTFRTIVQSMILEDKLFTGMAGYVTGIKFYWSHSIKTACAGHGFIFFNPDFFDRLTYEQQKTVVAHEIWHLICKHLQRGEGKDPDDYNEAGDHVINLGLQDDGFEINEGDDFGGVQLCCDPKYRGMSTEQVYTAIREEKERDPNRPTPQAAQGQPSKDQIEEMIKAALKQEADNTTLQEQKEKDENKQKHEKLHDPSGQAEYGSGTDGRLIDVLANIPEIKEQPYSKIFEKYLTDPLSGGKRSYSWPSRRPSTNGMRLKGKLPHRGNKNRLKHLLYGLDVSGSIQKWEADAFLTSARILKEKLNPTAMTLILWDTRIVLEKTYGEHDPIEKIQINAGGGTSLHCVYQRARELNPDAVVIFTDLHVTIPPEPEWDTIWFVSSKTIDAHTLSKVKYGDIYLLPEVK